MTPSAHNPHRWRPLMITVAILGLGLITLLLAWYFTGFRLFDVPEPGLQQITRFSGIATNPAWSPDGRQITFIAKLEDHQEEPYALYSLNLDSDQVRRLTDGQQNPYEAAWSPDQAYLAYTIQDHICLLRLNDDRSKQCVLAPRNAQRLSWSPDGRQLSFDSGGSIQYLSMTDGELVSPPQVIRTGAFAVWSPDGHCLAFQQGDGVNHSEVWISRSDGSAPQLVLQIEGGAYPFGWSSDNQFLYLQHYDFGEVHKLSALRLADGAQFNLTNNHDSLSSAKLAPDGKRIVFHSDRQGDSPARYAFNIYTMTTPALPTVQTARVTTDCLPGTIASAPAPQALDDIPRRQQGIVLPPSVNPTELIIGLMLVAVFVVWGSILLFLALLRAGLWQRPFRREARAIVLVFYGPAILVSGYLAIRAGVFLSPAQRLGWQTYQSPDNSFVVAVPGAPWEVVNGNTHDFTATQNHGLIFGVSYTDYPSEKRDQAEAILLDEAQQALTPAGSHVIFVKDASLAGSPGRAFRFRDSDDLTAATVVEGRLYLVGHRLYRVTVTYAVPAILSPEIDVFLDSFQLLKIPSAAAR